MNEHNIGDSEVKKLNREDIGRIIIMGIMIIVVIVFWIWDCVRSGRFSWGMGVVALVLCVILYMNIRMMLNRKRKFDIQKELMRYQKPSQRIKALEGYNAEGRFNSEMDTYYNLLSLCYYENGEYERALEENMRERDVIVQKLGGNTVVSGNPFLINRANEATFLMALGRYDEAEICITEVEEALEELNEKKSYKQYVEDIRRSFVVPHRAKLAIENSAPQTAKEFIAVMEENPQERTGTDEKFLIKLLKAEVLKAEGDIEKAKGLVDEVLSQCKAKPVLDRANKFAETL